MNNYNAAPGKDIAVIPKGTVINGNIDIEGKLEMYGEVIGNINSNDRINVCGSVTGNIKANDIYTRDSFIEGKIDCVMGAVVRDNTVILGDINAESLVVDGAIQGKLDVKGCVTVGSTAIIDSDIRAKNIQVSNGAAINGYCSLCYSDLKMDDIFPKMEEDVKPENTKPENIAKPENPVRDAKPRAIVRTKIKR